MEYWPPAPLPARRAYRPEGRAYASERAMEEIQRCQVSGTDRPETNMSPEH